MTYKVAFIGTGPEPDNPVWGETAAMAYRHAPGYRDDDRCDIVACADIVRENAEAFAAEFDIDDDHVFEDYDEMLATVEPDVLSVCTPVPTHADIVLDCLASGVVEGIHCEKPMATRWDDARLMAQEASRRDVTLTFNHQRRFSPAWREPKQLLDDGEIGELQRLEVGCGELLDMATHLIDLANFFNDERPVEWVLGNVDYREEHVKYGAHNENHGLAMWEYDNGVTGLVSTGVGEDAVGCQNRIIGTEGTIEVRPDGMKNYRVRRAGETEWETHEFEQTEISGTPPAVTHLVDCLEEGVEPETSARRALSVTEVIFAVYESARRRGRVNLPLRIDDNPLESMVESGALTPTPSED